MAISHGGFIRGSEAYLAGVYYVMKDAQESYGRDRKKIEGRRTSPWGFLNKVRGALGYDARYVPYSIMRKELQEFAEVFGTDRTLPGAPTTITEREAQKEFGL